MKDILNSHSVTALKKEIAKTNIKGYGKMKKAEIVTLMMKHKDRFSHLKHSGNKGKPKKEYKSKEFVSEDDNVPDKPKKKTYKDSKRKPAKSVKRKGILIIR